MQSEPAKINIPPVIGPNRTPVTNATPYPKAERPLQQVAQEAANYNPETPRKPSALQG